jgi:hypothetical protein
VGGQIHEDVQLSTIEPGRQRADWPIRIPALRHRTVRGQKQQADLRVRRYGRAAVAVAPPEAVKK